MTGAKTAVDRSKNFNQAAEITIGHEAGYVNDPNDPGGETKFGVSKRSYPHLDIKNLTRDQALNVYYEDYWVKCGADDMPYSVGLCVFDFAINSGVAKAIITLQRSLNALGCRDVEGNSLAEDGDWGARTNTALNTKPENFLDVVEEITARRTIFLSHLSTWKHYKLGWSRRIIDLVVQATKSECESAEVSGTTSTRSPESRKHRKNK